MSKDHRHAIYPGTFDPVTHGHLDIITRAGRIFDHLTIAVAQGGDTLFSIEERTQFLKHEVARLHAVTSCHINVLPFHGLLVDFARQQHIAVIIRGLRPVSDFEYEFKMAVTNTRLDSKIETVFLMASDPHHFTSAHLVREITSMGGSARPFTTDHVADALEKRTRQASSSTYQKTDDKRSK